MDVLIIGGGPAGVSAALYTARAGLETVIIKKSYGALDKAEKVDNFYGAAGVSGRGLVGSGLAQAVGVGAKVIDGEVVKIEQDMSSNHFTVETAHDVYSAKTVLLATGASRATPAIPGLDKYEGKGVSHCAVCDAFFFKGKDVAVLGSGNYALSEAKELLPLVNSVTLLTNGKEPEIQFPSEITVRSEKIRSVVGEARLMGVAFEPNGEELPVSGLFIAMGIAGASELARKIGIPVDKGSLMVDKNMRTDMPGIWAAGDCTGGMKQIAKAVYEGAVAGTDIVRFIRGQS